MKSRIQLWGNSLALRIPKPFAEDIGIADGSSVDISLDDGRLIIEPVHAVENDELAKMVALITDENRHSEIDWGEPQGKEIW
jgi:antitoxin MazE